MSLSSGDIEKISIDKSLAGKVPDPINKGVYHMMDVVIMCLLGSVQFFMNSLMTEQVNSVKTRIVTIA